MDQPDGGERLGREERIAPGVSIRKDGSGKPVGLRIAFQYRGEECRERLDLIPTAPNRRYAERLRGEILNAIGRGAFNYADYFPRSPRAKKFGFTPSTKTVGELIAEYEPLASRALSPSTWKGYKKVIDRCIVPWFGGTRLLDLTTGLIYTHLLAEEVTIKTARNILTPLSMALRLAVDRHELERNPAEGVKLRGLWPRERKSDWRPDPFTFEEMEAIFAACEPSEQDYWRFAFGTGMRPSEQIALDWRQVDTTQRRVHVLQAQVAGIDGAAMKEPKTEAGNRVIVLTMGAWQALERTAAAGGTEGRVFRDARYGGPWRDDQTLRKRWSRILAKAKVRYRNPYQTRHTFASTLLAGGRPPTWVARQMGHEGIGMLHKHYARWIEQGATTSGAAIAEFFSHASPATAEIVSIRYLNQWGER